VIVAPKLYDCRDAFQQRLLELAELDERIVVVSNDSVGSSKLGDFKKTFPDRLVNVGIAEQDLVGVGAGLANAGKIPFVFSASCFLTGRALEQIKVDCAYSNANVKLVGISAGMAYGPLGPTHHSIEDLAWTRAIADLTVVVPTDPVDTRQIVEAAATTSGPIFIRLSRMEVPQIHGDEHRFEFGKATLLRAGRDVTLIATGVTVSRALEAARLLASDGVDARVLEISTIRPLDTDAIVAAARETGAIVTVEEHTVYGGLGGAVAEVVVQHAPVPMRILGVPGVFAPTGDAEWLVDEYFGLSGAGIRRATLSLTRCEKLCAD
jgi:transketolase